MPRPSRTELLPRVAFGAVYLVFSVNGLLAHWTGSGFLPMPEPTPEGGAFIGALIATGYLWPLVKATQLVGALLVLSGRFTALGLVVLAPITLNVVLYHVFLDPSGLALPLGLLGLHLWLAWRHRERFRPLFRG